MKNNSAIELTSVTKKYSIRYEKPTLAERIMNGKSKGFVALNRINLVIKKGERVGIIGANGSGKTTLLKIITQISTPTSGKAIVNGKVVSLIDLSAGFHPEITGKNNIYINGMILGMRKSDIEDKVDNIIEFAQLGNFINAPLFTYSSGMQLRLGFAIAVHADPDILVMDENIAVGDMDFQKKCKTFIDSLILKGKTIITASHDLNFIKENCNVAILLKKGKVAKKGPVNKVIQYYLTKTNTLSTTNK